VTTIAIIGCKGIPARYGGFETLAENLVRHLGEQYDFIVYCSKEAYPDQPPGFLGAELKYLPLDANGAQSIPYDIWSMIDASRRADVLLVLGVSGCIFLPILRLFCRGKIIVNLDGMDWKRPKWGRAARAFLKFSETVAARFADYLVADNEAIHDYILEYYGKPSQLVEYGGDNARADAPKARSEHSSVVPLHKPDGSKELIKTGFDEYAISVCRIEPEKNIHVILQAFAEAQTLPLVFLGNWNYSEYGRRLRVQYEGHANLLLLDPIFEQRQLHALRSNAALYIHGHSSGGTNPSLVESMSLGLPVIAFDVVFNRATTENKAAYFKDAATLKAALKDLAALDLPANATRMRELARRRYSWAIIASKYTELFGLAMGHERRRRRTPVTADAAADPQETATPDPASTEAKSAQLP
jgi:glycosyltransferase involved in cell wall biosynthesis